MPLIHPPFTQSRPVRSRADILSIEQARPLAEALPVRSTYEIFCNSAHAFADKTALTFLRTADPADAPIRWSYRRLLAGIHQTANALHALGLQSTDAVAGDEMSGTDGDQRRDRGQVRRLAQGGRMWTSRGIWRSR